MVEQINLEIENKKIAITEKLKNCDNEDLKKLLLEKLNELESMKIWA